MAIYYRTKDGQADYAFNIERRNDNTWRAYIERQPSYQGRADDSQSTHRLSDGNRKYVCWSEPLRSEAAARSAAALWADATQQYIRNGTSF